MKIDIFLPVEDLGDAAMTDPELPADHTGANTGGGHLDDLGVDEDEHHGRQ